MAEQSGLDNGVLRILCFPNGGNTPFENVSRGLGFQSAVFSFFFLVANFGNYELFLILTASLVNARYHLGERGSQRAWVAQQQMAAGSFWAWTLR